ncbi:hypothetical protein ACFE04_001491 [Oxalis oulophora]
MISSGKLNWHGSCHHQHLLFFYYLSYRRFSSTDSTQTEFPTQNAYDILGVTESCSFAEIKASFHKLAKETHPDLTDSDTSQQRFIQILAAYEILSDSTKRAHYDMYLLSQRKVVQKASRQGSTLYRYESKFTSNKEMEVVEWLRWYRMAVNNMLSEKRVVSGGTGYFDELEEDFYSAMHLAYFGPEIECFDNLPDRFEAEERSMDTPEVLHLVSGRDLFGMVCLVNKFPKLSYSFCGKFLSFSPASSEIGRLQELIFSENMSDSYRDLELHISGRLVAFATRVPPKMSCNGVSNEDDDQDRIHVFLNSDTDSMSSSSQRFSKDSNFGNRAVSTIPIGMISGLGTNIEEGGECYVYDSCGSKTHMILKHRTLLVKHLHWYQVGDEVSVCECRCSRARLPPSKFWLFEPRCGMHDIGGWYVETFGRDKKGRTVPSQRYWDGVDANEQYEKRLHPAMYLLALAYRTLDIEDARARKITVKDMVETKLFRLLNWKLFKVVEHYLLHAEGRGILLDIHPEGKKGSPWVNNMVASLLKWQVLRGNI